MSGVKELTEWETEQLISLLRAYRRNNPGLDSKQFAALRHSVFEGFRMGNDVHLTTGPDGTHIHICAVRRKRRAVKREKVDE